MASRHPLFTEALRDAAFPTESAVNGDHAAFRALTAALGDDAKDGARRCGVIRNRPGHPTLVVGAGFARIGGNGRLQGAVIGVSVA